MFPIRRVSLTAATVLLLTALVAGCASTSPSPAAPSATATTPASSAAAIPPPTASTAPATLIATPTTAASAVASAGSSQLPIRTPVPGSSLDPALSDSGIVGRITMPNDARNGWSGTYEILGVAADGSECSYSLDGNEFTAVAWYASAPNGMLHQMSVTVPTDEMPANDGEQRAGITDGSVYADFVSDSGFGTAYTGAEAKGDGSTSKIDIGQSGILLTFSFSGSTWDQVDFTGQMMCDQHGE